MKCVRNHQQSTSRLSFAVGRASCWQRVIRRSEPCSESLMTMNRTSLLSIFYFFIWSCSSNLSHGFSTRPNPIRHLGLGLAKKKFRSLQTSHLLPQLPEDNRYDCSLYSGGPPIENTDDDDKGNGLNLKVIIPVVALLAAAAAAVGSGKFGTFDFQQIIEQSASKIEKMGPYGYVYFALIYIVAEVLAVPALPLTASSGYLFGLIPGFLTVLVSATIAASISFLIGRTLLREWAQKIASTSSKWRAIDSAVGREGFKVILLLRMSPLLPFAISNYLYGLTSVDFWSYITATFLGFAPGTLGIVYAGTAGKALFSDGISGFPIYVYAAAGGLLFLFGKTVASIATDAIKAIELEDAAEAAALLVKEKDGKQ